MLVAGEVVFVAGKDFSLLGKFVHRWESFSGGVGAMVANIYSALGFVVTNSDLKFVNY